MAYVKGDWIRLYSGGVPLTLEMEVSVSVTVDTIETTDKDSAGWKTFTTGDKSWTVSATANLDWSAAENITQTYTDLVAGSAIAYDVGSANNAKFYSGNGVINSFNFDGPRNGLATFSLEIQGTGALTEGTAT